MKIQESAENYLETIYSLSQELGNVRSIDIVNAMGFSKPSVSVAMKNLKLNGYILIDTYGYIQLTLSGLQIAKSIYERHTTLTQLLLAIGVTPEIAKEDACRLEHAMSEETFEKIKAYANRNALIDTNER